MGTQYPGVRAGRPLAGAGHRRGLSVPRLSERVRTRSRLPHRSRSVDVVRTRPRRIRHAASRSVLRPARGSRHGRFLASVRGAHLVGPVRQHQHREHALVPEGFQFPAGTDSVRVRSARVDEGYFDTLGIASSRAAVSSHRHANVRASPSSTRLSRRAIGPAGAPRHTLPAGRDDACAVGQIVGIAADTRYRALSEGPTEFIYYPRRRYRARRTIMLHTDGDPRRSPGRCGPPSARSIPTFRSSACRTMEDFYRASSVACRTC